uniref:Uncharacterized protein n=1 Tax=Oryza nivara TaxID=4536 RepID=A0A0E0IPA7_ORYNI
MGSSVRDGLAIRAHGSVHGGGGDGGGQAEVDGEGSGHAVALVDGQEVVHGKVERMGEGGGRWGRGGDGGGRGGAVGGSARG